MGLGPSASTKHGDIISVLNGPAALFVNDTIAQNTIVIFSKTHCPYCEMAKDIFKKLDKDFTAIELDRRKDGKEIQRVLGEITGSKTVPSVFIKGVYVGGGSDVKILYQSGKLAAMLDQTD